MMAKKKETSITEVVELNTEEKVEAAVIASPVPVMKPVKKISKKPAPRINLDRYCEVLGIPKWEQRGRMVWAEKFAPKKIGRPVLLNTKEQWDEIFKDY